MLGVPFFFDAHDKELAAVPLVAKNAIADTLVSLIISFK